MGNTRKLVFLIVFCFFSMVKNGSKRKNDFFFYEKIMKKIVKLMGQAQ